MEEEEDEARWSRYDNDQLVVPVVAIFCLAMMPFGAVVVHKARRRRRDQKAGLIKGETPEASSPVSVAADVNADAGGSVAKPSPATASPVPSTSPVAGSASTVRWEGPQAPTTRWLVKGDHYDSTAL